MNPDKDYGCSEVQKFDNRKILKIHEKKKILSVYQREMLKIEIGDGRKAL